MGTSSHQGSRFVPRNKFALALERSCIGVWVYRSGWITNQGYTRVFEYAQVFGSPTGATHWCLESQPGLHTGVWIPSRSYTRVFGIPTGATHGRLESQAGER